MQPLCGIKVVEFGGVGPGPFAATALAELTDRLAAVLRTKTRAQWEAIFDGAQACATPVLTLDEAPLHPHHRARVHSMNPSGSCAGAPLSALLVGHRVVIDPAAHRPSLAAVGPASAPTLRHGSTPWQTSTHPVISVNDR